MFIGVQSQNCNNLQLKCMKSWGGSRVPVLMCVF